MARWKPDALDRLREAAMELFHERGYADTTVADIAAHAGLTERTFFRYFTDKREVLFSGSELLQKTITDAIASSPKSAAPLQVVANAFAATGTFFDAMRPHSRRRQAIINAHAELRERELIKMATIAAAVAEALRKHGVREPLATLAAETGTALFKNAFERWLADRKAKEFATYVHAALADLRTVARSA